MNSAVERGNAILASLCEATGALAAVVRDVASPVTWWRAGSHGSGVGEALLENLRHAAISALDGGSPASGARVRFVNAEKPPRGIVFSFAGIYLLVVAMEKPFNRFRVEPHLRRALPILEGLVPRLPPLDDSPGGGAEIRSLRQKPPRWH